MTAFRFHSLGISTHCGMLGCGNTTTPNVKELSDPKRIGADVYGASHRYFTTSRLETIDARPRRPRAGRNAMSMTNVRFAIPLTLLGSLIALPAMADTTFFSTGDPDGK